MVHFSGDTAELQDATAYEVGVINELRAILHRQSEAVGDGMAVTLGKYGQNGRLLRNLNMSCHMSVSEDAVWNALDRLRPLAFSAAFKIHDMIVEWILRANNINEWSFKKKLDAYDSLGATLNEPNLLSSFPALSQAMWSLFRFFVPFRGSVVHRGGVSLEADSTITIIRDDQTLRLTANEQAAYMRALCMLVQMLTHPTPPTQFQRDIVENDFHALRHYHHVPGLRARDARFEVLTVRVPDSYLGSRAPCELQVDFDELRDLMETSFPSATTGTLYYSVLIVANAGTRELTWNLPADAVPGGQLVMCEGNPDFDRYLSIRNGLTEST